MNSYNSDKNNHKLRVFADIYLDPVKDAELIRLCNELGRFIRNPIFIGLADLARENSWLDMKHLTSSEEGIKDEKVKIIRLQIVYMLHPELLELWENLPRGTKSATFVALIKSALERLDGEIPKEILVRKNVIPTTPKEDKEVLTDRKSNFTYAPNEDETPFDGIDEDDDIWG